MPCGSQTVCNQEYIVKQIFIIETKITNQQFITHLRMGDNIQDQAKLQCRCEYNWQDIHQYNAAQKRNNRTLL